MPRVVVCAIIEPAGNACWSGSVPMPIDKLRTLRSALQSMAKPAAAAAVSQPRVYTPEARAAQPVAPALSAEESDWLDAAFGTGAHDESAPLGTSYDPGTRSQSFGVRVPEASSRYVHDDSEVPERVPQIITPIKPSPALTPDEHAAQQRDLDRRMGLSTRHEPIQNRVIHRIGDPVDGVQK